MATQAKNGLCPAPFLQESLFPETGGFIDGRFCETTQTTRGAVSCCLPCPSSDWRYTDLNSNTKVASWLNVAILPLSIFLLASYAVLPAKWTHRHYLSICFTLGICFMELAFIIPLGSKPNQCYNEITPNDMRSDLSCAFTGSFLLFGGWVVIMWSFLRTVALHLQVCWEILIGPKFMAAALLAGWGIPAIGLALMLVFTGVSYRFGNTCHINHANSLRDYWIPLMVFAFAALLLQMTTLIYCIHIYVRSFFDDKATTTNSSALPSYSGSVRSTTARQAYRRVRRVIQLQWRGIAIVLTIIGNVIFFAVVFIRMDNSLRLSPEMEKKAAGWIVCLALTKGDRNACVDKAHGVGPNEATVLAVLILLSLSGLWNFIFLVRTTMIMGWVNLVKGLFKPQSEFVSADARVSVPDPRSYEMLSSGDKSLKSPDPVVTSPDSGMSSTLRFSDSKGQEPGDYFGRDAKYTQPAYSFSAPRPPPASRGNSPGHWDPQSTFARSTSPYGHDYGYQKP
ncbi:hypothetical protein DTO271D3_8602 [Paecilomyces variotii]|nr:hypothetical protein DTO169C6_270 [Paecilomyces variotii]KAJ9273668.1 hypothetical protein DTO212C5_302 [Paecilomyces variotii]KAJ9311113.1 hypothetical protein DTO271D3_8602 [Paecilomyces variotii]KAJ9379215.1 hypothetical protein DTO063F5_7314 [Paecilomyces variotii]